MPGMRLPITRTNVHAGLNNNTMEANMNRQTFSDRAAAIVTGASRGIGAAIAARLAQEGRPVVVNYCGSAAKAAELVAEITGKGGRAVAVKADVTVPQQAESLFDAAEKQFGEVGVLVNNAGLMQPGLVPLAQTDDELFDRIVAVNFRGVFNMCWPGTSPKRNTGK